MLLLNGYLGCYYCRQYCWCC